MSSSNSSLNSPPNSSLNLSSKTQPIRPTSRPLAKSYDPSVFEQDLYQFWEKAGCFEASDESSPDHENFAMMIPPPNVTGRLHIGHALTFTIEDILIRWRRMRGDNTLYMPGTDHAGIATQIQVEKQIATEGKGPSGKPLTRHDIGREKFLERTWQWKVDHQSIIQGQLRRMGCSFDWRRERFTMDEGLSKAVREVFVSLYEEGLIYRGERIINWDVKAKTALSDLEVEPTERKGFLWHIRYDLIEKDGSPVLDPQGQPSTVVIATTRPETLLGDSAIAVHPEDDRFTHVHGKFAKVPLVDRIIPIVKDDYVDREFGSGGLKVTPAHDFNDYDIGQRHGLELISVISKDGKMTEASGPYQGLGITECRDKVIEDLEKAGQLVKIEKHVHRVGLSQRTGIPAEPLLSKQWFVKIAPLAKPAIEAVKNGDVQFSPKTWEKTYFEWMNNIRDWCISRQLWWGHRIPAWHCDDCEHISVSRDDLAECEKCQSKNVRQDEDVLDTWFSSGLWPFTTLGWPDKTKALDTFYPNAILETGFDIIFFWVARMVMFGLHFMKDVPFKRIYLHAMVRDENGHKMSKSKGNVIDPIQIIDRLGTDPLRFTLAVMAAQGRDVKLSEDRIVGYKAFCNKLWNAVKFFHMNFEDSGVDEPAEGLEPWIQKNFKNLTPENRWILTGLQDLAETVDQGLDQFNLQVASQGLYDFTWGELCDWFIEFSKVPLRTDGEAKAESLLVLRYALEQILRLLHPIIPHVTEELWQSLPWTHAANSTGRMLDGRPKVESLMLQSWPRPQKALMDAQARAQVDQLRTIIEAIRSFRGENQISPKKEFEVRFVARDPSAAQFVESIRDKVVSLARISGLTEVAPTIEAEQEAVLPLAAPAIDLRISLDGLVDLEGEKKRISKELDKVRGDLTFVEKKLSNVKFVSKAPPALVEEQKAKQAHFRNKLKELEAALERIS